MVTHPDCSVTVGAVHILHADSSQVQHLSDLSCVDAIPTILPRSRDGAPQLAVRLEVLSADGGSVDRVHNCQHSQARSSLVLGTSRRHFGERDAVPDRRRPWLIIQLVLHAHIRQRILKVLEDDVSFSVLSPPAPDQRRLSILRRGPSRSMPKLPFFQCLDPGQELRLALFHVLHGLSVPRENRGKLGGHQCTWGTDLTGTS